MIIKLLKAARFKVFSVLGKIDPKIIAHIMYYEAHHSIMNLKRPHTLDEKINWLKFNSDTSIWSKLADKFEVRKFIRERGLGHTLNNVFGCFDTPDSIDINTLPESFVIKSTNGSSGMQVKLVKRKSDINWPLIKEELRHWLTYSPPFTIAEPHYASIKPRLLVEKLLTDKGNKSLIDYKFHCFDGKVVSCLVCADRVEGKAVKSIYDLSWTKHPECVREQYKDTPEIARPNSLDKMIEYSQILSKGFPYVRVDWYEIDGNPVFSEMTFTPAGGYNKTMSEQYLIELGQYLNIK